MPIFDFTDEEFTNYRRIIKPIVANSAVKQMKLFKQHGSISTYNHCERVARISYLVNCRLHLRGNAEDLIKGAMLHDFYLYDWHNEDNGTHKWHGFSHPQSALINARRYFKLSPCEEDIIASHMWPLTLRRMPKTREAAIVCMVDKLCSLRETVFMRARSK